jgi:hypothetical protein
VRSVSTDEQTLLATPITVIQEAIDLAERREQLTVTGYVRRVSIIEERFAAWLLQVARRRRAISHELDRLVNHVANHFDEWLLFLREPDAPPTNNHAERMLRPAQGGRLQQDAAGRLGAQHHGQPHGDLQAARPAILGISPPAVERRTTPGYSTGSSDHPGAARRFNLTKEPIDPETQPPDTSPQRDDGPSLHPSPTRRQPFPTSGLHARPLP